MPRLSNSPTYDAGLSVWISDAKLALVAQTVYMT